MEDRHPLLWDSSAAGHVEANEDYDEAAARELMEELGVSARLERLGKLPASEKTGQEFIMVYRGKHNGPFSFPCEEISAVEFFRLKLWSDGCKTSPKILRQDSSSVGIYSRPNRPSYRPRSVSACSKLAAARCRRRAKLAWRATVVTNLFQPDQFRLRQIPAPPF